MRDSKRDPESRQEDVNISAFPLRNARLRRRRARLRRLAEHYLATGEASVPVVEGILHELERREAAEEAAS